jgi:putative peptidoglycan lipid II flippase
MALLGDVVIATVYQTGQFGRSDVLSGWTILAGSTIGLLASTQGRLCSTAFYAMRDSKTPLYFACVRVVLTAVSGYFLAVPIREALHLSTTMGAAFLTGTAGLSGWVEFVLLRRALSRTIGEFRSDRRTIAKFWLIAGFSAMLAYGIKLILPALNPMLEGVVVLGSYGLSYMGTTITLGLGEGKAIGQRLKKLARW